MSGVYASDWAEQGRNLLDECRIQQPQIAGTMGLCIRRLTTKGRNIISCLDRGRKSQGVQKLRHAVDLAAVLMKKLLVRICTFELPSAEG